MREGWYLFAPAGATPSRGQPSPRIAGPATSWKAGPGACLLFFLSALAGIAHCRKWRAYGWSSHQSRWLAMPLVAVSSGPSARGGRGAPAVDCDRSRRLSVSAAPVVVPGRRQDRSVLCCRHSTLREPSLPWCLYVIPVRVAGLRSGERGPNYPGYTCWRVRCHCPCSEWSTGNPDNLPALHAPSRHACI